eukprot:s3832_g4.t1
MGPTGPPKPSQKSSSAVPGQHATIRSTRMRNAEQPVPPTDTDMEVGLALGRGATARVPNPSCLAVAAGGVMMLHAKHCAKDVATGVVMTKGNVIVGMSLSFPFDSGAVEHGLLFRLIAAVLSTVGELHVAGLASSSSVWICQRWNLQSLSNFAHASAQ